MSIEETRDKVLKIAERELGAPVQLGLQMDDTFDDSLEFTQFILAIKEEIKDLPGEVLVAASTFEDLVQVLCA